MIRGIFFAAIVAGLVASLVLTAVQRFEVVPIILQAESYESGAHAHASGNGAAAHGHVDEEWAPHDGIERTFWTAVANAGAGIGFALLLCAAYAWRGGVTLREGVLWGSAGFLVFFVNPSFGLQPEIPGAAAADVGARQLWWLGAVACTGVGLWLLAFTLRWSTALAGALLCLVPHVIGAPLAGEAHGSAPVELAHAFLGATYLANGVFWIVLGTASAYVFTRFTRLERTVAT
ncbi:MAG: CbtA family protein [Gammaproteobacteria bacterium]|nr:CbtA family protein [Gammaproteobacteria bacterium]